MSALKMLGMLPKFQVNTSPKLLRKDDVMEGVFNSQKLRASNFPIRDSYINGPKIAESTGVRAPYMPSLAEIDKDTNRRDTENLFRKWLTGFSNSPMGKQMLRNSSGSDLEYSRLHRERREALNSAPIFYTKQMSNNLAGFYNPVSHSIDIHDRGEYPEFKILHELGHAQDKWSALIPDKDKAKMSKYASSSSYKPSGIIDQLKNKFMIRDSSETRARLGELRFWSHGNDIYNPNQELAPKDFIKKYEGSRAVDMTPLNDLRKIYGDVEILDLLNSVSQGVSNKKVQSVQVGGSTFKF